MSEDLSSKVAMIVDNGLFSDIAQRIAPAFKKVYYWSDWIGAFPSSSKLLPGDGFEDIERVKWKWPAIEKSDLIIYPDVYYGDEQKAVEAMGKRVWGARRGEMLELDRVHTKEMLKGLGEPVGGYEVITGIDDLRKYIKENPNVWVKLSCNRGDAETFHAENYDLIEPRIDEIEHRMGAKASIVEFIVEDNIEAITELGYDGYTIDGKWPKRSFFGLERKDKGFIGRVIEWDEFPAVMRHANEVLSPYFAKHGYRGFYSSELRITDPETAYLIDPCCYSDDTEVLTERGWKKFSDLEKGEQVCTLNPTTSAIEYQTPSSYTAYPHDGEMISISSAKKRLDLLVTPNHSIWAYPVARTPKPLMEVRADKATGKYSIPRTGKWVGETPTHYGIDEYKSQWSSGNEYHISKEYTAKAKRIEIKTWLSFLAMYLAEGNCDQWVVNIAQTKHKDEFRQVISRLPFKWTEHAKGFRIFSVQLVELLKPILSRSERGIPQHVKRLSPELINHFLDWYALSDGSVRPGRGRICSTTSRLTADDLQELFLKAGSVADIAVAIPKGTPVAISGGKYVTKHDGLQVRESITNTQFYFEGWNVKRQTNLKRVPYAGWVYDVEVPNHILFVRRNGKPCWSGNCRAASPPHEIYLELFDNWPEIFWHGAGGEMVDPNPVAKYGCCAMLHSLWGVKNWLPLRLPDSVRQWVKLRNHCRIDGVDYFVPQPDSELPEIGAVIGIGDTMQEAEDHLRENAEQIKAYDVDIKLDCFDDMKEEIDGAAKLGIEV